MYSLGGHRWEVACIYTETGSCTARTREHQATAHISLQAHIISGRHNHQTTNLLSKSLPKPAQKSKPSSHDQKPQRTPPHAVKMTPPPAPHPTASAWKIIPHFPSRSIPATIAFYTSILGFTLGGTYVHDDHPLAAAGDPTFASLAVGDKAAANIYFFLTVEGKDRDRTMGEGRVMIALKEGEVDVLYEKLKGLEEERTKRSGEMKGEEGREWGIVDEIGDMPWGYRQFTVRDGDGNHLSFFNFLEDGEDGEDEKEVTDS